LRREKSQTETFVIRQKFLMTDADGGEETGAITKATQA
jgi:hypothetical protein